MTGPRTLRRVVVAVGAVHGLAAVAALLLAAWTYVDWLTGERGDYSGLAFIVILPGLALGLPLLVLAALAMSRTASTAFGAAVVIGLADLVAALAWASQVAFAWDDVTLTTAVLVAAAVVVPPLVVGVAGLGLAEAQRDRSARLVAAARVLLGLYAVAGTALLLLVLPIVAGLTDEPASTDGVGWVLLGLAPVVVTVVALRSPRPRVVHCVGIVVAAASLVVCFTLAVASTGVPTVLVGVVPALALGGVSCAWLRDAHREVRHEPCGV
ncbi:hypothetical protein [Nocardioides rubriscoriae]|uniref:hypothetical protein n=1 Tax=Nocardioides rubriscoriae TaxID=642762 RepID=UPI0011DF2636|nr:hypothetical protein [Nocardioides rubriscoriae]